MIEERYCSRELSKLLKEKGFDEPCLCAWLLGDDMTYRFQSSIYHNCLEDNEYLCPTHQMACDWLRDKGYHIEIFTNASGYRFIISKIPPNGTDLVCDDIEGNNDGGAWDNYGECIEDAIKYCLMKII